tara:strand:- start:377 stop:1270 length:894 start_codon:yes stop_codon:yes gene_type:complete
MKNTHLEHPEDLILTGDLDAIRAMYDSDSHISMKIDGAPAIVWGTNPNNGKFFVCTKSAFNKKKIKLCYSIDDIFDHFGHQMNVFEILSYCFKYIPRTDKVYQGDWMGFGRTEFVKPNTLVYEFNEKVMQKIIIAPHTEYTIKGEMWEAEAHPLKEYFNDTAIIKWVQPSVDRISSVFDMTDIDTKSIQFMTDKEASAAKIKINALIRDGVDLTDSELLDVLGCIYLVNIYQMVIEMKEDLLDSLIVHDAPNSFLPCGLRCKGEGFVISNDYGMMKLVDRTVFSHANMTQGRFRRTD